MTVPPDVLGRIVTLTGLALPPEDLDALRADVARILEFVRAIEAGGAVEAESTFWPGPSAAPLRPDQPTPADLARPIETVAPASRDGFVLAPRPPGVETA